MFGRRVDEGIPISPNRFVRRPHYTVTISGSLQRFVSEIGKDISKFQSLGVNVLSPSTAQIDSISRGFATLEGDPSQSNKMTENRHLDAIANSSLLWLVAPDGRPGYSTTLEIGYALAKKIPVFSTNSFDDIIFRDYIKKVSDPKQALNSLVFSDKSFTNTILLNPKLAINIIRQELNELERILEWESGPMNLHDSESVADIIIRIKNQLGVLGDFET